MKKEQNLEKDQKAFHRGNVSGLLQPISSVMEFAEWCKENNEILHEKGCDVLGCVKEWELALMSSSNNEVAVCACTHNPPTRIVEDGTELCCECEFPVQTD